MNWYLRDQSEVNIFPPPIKLTATYSWNVVERKWH